jgi:hypothetical protein
MAKSKLDQMIEQSARRLKKTLDQRWAVENVHEENQRLARYFAEELQKTFVSLFDGYVVRDGGLRSTLVINLHFPIHSEAKHIHVAPRSSPARELFNCWVVVKDRTPKYFVVDGAGNSTATTLPNVIQQATDAVLEVLVPPQ